jgi:hypothetical protein
MADVVQFVFHGPDLPDHVVEVPVEQGKVTVGCDAPAGYTSVSVIGPDIPLEKGAFYID